ncbi:ribosome small subunit-dependent GTPase A [Paenibacillus crassostreae]|uniref:Small ribosomal subunit biogenesis GTPase RsgA n=1 Tax=Paenibacillus crassostreae TaxID=1763538 RepID=A0A167FK48_9BACL|nr:ribosome small subunit-dependent GTPase A [Paenibacillus crassostreae]AOZ94319.1 ribosome small subunit-dependent GTPase A [Paenibacillus crassostreae]OAB76643.1 GTPase RsgA [Paenibacillus crassostreae]
MDLKMLGWNDHWEQQWSICDRKDTIPARIVGDFGQKYRVITEQNGDTWAEMSGKLQHELDSRSSFPSIGDWVAVQPLAGEDRVIIQGVLDRKTCISRQAAGFVTHEQIIAANVDTLFLVCALNDDFNVRRIERYLIMAWNSGVNPVILLSKADLCSNIDEKLGLLQESAMGVPVHVVCAIENQGFEDVDKYLTTGSTVALTGSSGCGKSTIINWLFGAVLQRTQEVREGDSRGRHTTTHRELFLLPQGAVMIDTPGMRELKLWEDEGGLSLTFADIEELRRSCKFTDCRHEQELGCAVLQAVSNGEIEEKRLLNYHKTLRELKFQAKKEAKSNSKQTKRGTKTHGTRLKGQALVKQLND